MLACVDVDYRGDGTAVAACLGFHAWTADRATASWIVRVDAVEPYVPGALYRRELPCLLAVIARAGRSFDAIVVDAYVTLDAAGTPGLGAHLDRALRSRGEERSAIIGVAKTPYRAATTAIPVLRGASAKPLWVSAIGIEPAAAAEHVRSMHGASRVPTLLRAVDRAARDG